MKNKILLGMLFALLVTCMPLATVHALPSVDAVTDGDLEFFTIEGDKTYEKGATVSFKFTLNDSYPTEQVFAYVKLYKANDDTVKLTETGLYSAMFKNYQAGDIKSVEVVFKIDEDQDIFKSPAPDVDPKVMYNTFISAEIGIYNSTTVAAVDNIEDAEPIFAASIVNEAYPQLQSVLDAEASKPDYVSWAVGGLALVGAGAILLGVFMLIRGKNKSIDI